MIPIASQTLTDDDNRNSNLNTEDKLIKYGEHTKRKIDQARLATLRKEKSELSFQPQISYISEKIMQEKSRLFGKEDNVFETLYR